MSADVDSDLTTWNLRTEASREAAQECSPRRQPWVVLQERQSPEGATETSPKNTSLYLRYFPIFLVVNNKQRLFRRVPRSSYGK